MHAGSEATVSMHHNAYRFEWAAFDRDLRPQWVAALDAGDSAPLQRFVRDGAAQLRDPADGAALPSDWDTRFDVDDARTLGRLALTRYYDPASNLGLGEGWEILHDAFREEPASPVLGHVIGTRTTFAPAETASYFQSAEQVANSRSNLRRLSCVSGELARAVDLMLDALETATGAGLYVTLQTP